MITLRDCLLCYFAANAEEELTRPDVVTKFDRSASTTWEVLRTMCREELLIATHGPQRGRELTYRRGPQLEALLGVKKAPAQ